MTAVDSSGDVLSGWIINVIKDFIEFTFGMKSEKCDEGVPLLNDELRVVGIYSGLWDPSMNLPPIVIKVRPLAQTVTLQVPQLIRQQILKAY